MAENKLSPEDLDQFIVLYYNMKCLWDVRCKEYKDLTAINKAYATIADILNISVEIVKKRLIICDRRTTKKRKKFFRLKEQYVTTFRIPTMKQWNETENKIINIITTTMGLKIEDKDIDRVQRIGKPNSNVENSRPITVKFSNYKTKNLILKNANKLKHTKLGISEQFSKTVIEQRKILRPYMIEAKNNRKMAKIIFNKLIVDEVTYTVDTVHILNGVDKTSTTGATDIKSKLRSNSKKQ
ncbi:hypothetical protein FQR65_LT14571 [Abscondita terminalis]|nr:hypothetical protein FQR65_LT14571 [Abscondita terminalis]